MVLQSSQPFVMQTAMACSDGFEKILALPAHDQKAGKILPPLISSTKAIAKHCEAFAERAHGSLPPCGISS